MTVAVVERLKQESMYGLSVGTRKWRLSEVAVSGGSVQFISVYCFTLRMYCNNYYRCIKPDKKTK